MVTHEKATGFSLWLVLQEGSKSYQFLSSIIGKLAAVYQTFNFEPHVTLLGSIEGNADEVIAKTRELSKNFSSFSISLKELGSQDNYFRAFFAYAEQNQVMAANATAQKIFGMSQDYMPHLSLAYGHFSEEQVLCLRQLAATTDMNHGSFEASNIHVYQTEGTVPEWKLIAVIPLRAK